jgi:histidinol-phosphate/aromatic aminotransferase/cobyric acid decarboxylase-like protein/choline kinase
MQAIILAAGRGRRMEPLSRHCHKALLDIGGTTILGRALDSLIGAGVSPITVVTGYRADDIVGFIDAEYPDAAVRYVMNENYDTTNNIVSLALALENLEYDEDVILVECDLIFDPGLIKELLDYPAKNVAMVDRYRTGMDGTVVAVEDGYVSQVFPAASQGADFRYQNKFKTLNIYRFDRHFCQKTLRPMVSAYAHHVDGNSYYELVLGMLANIPRHRIAAQVVAESDWVEVDDPNDLGLARFAFDPAARPALLDRCFGGHWAFDILDFSLPRNAYFPTPSMHAAMRHSLPDVITGYGSAQPVLDEKLRLVLGCEPGRATLLAGASQAYPILRQFYSGARVACPAPTFGEYSRAFPQSLHYLDRPGIDVDDLSRMARDVDLLVMVNPNNPTGSTVPSQSIYDIADSTPSTEFLVDESFIAFSGQPSLVSLLEADPLRNVTVLTSLGKSFGVPGLRLGYIYSSGGAIRDALADLMPIWGVNALAEFFLELVLKFKPDLDASIAATVAERTRLREELAGLPYIERVYDSGANFLLVQLRGASPESAAALRAELLETSRIEVKDVSAKFGRREPRLRFAVRTQEDNDQLLAALQCVRSIR